MEGQSPILSHILNFTICRFCMRKPEPGQNVVYTNIFETTIKSFQLKDLILKYFRVEVTKEKDKSNVICKKCFTLVKQWVSIKLKEDESQHIINSNTKNKLKPLNGNEIEIDDKNEYDINMTPASVPKSKNFNNSDLDVIIHDTNEIISNEEKYGNQFPKHSQNDTEGHVETVLNTFQTEIYQRPLITRLKPTPLGVPFDNNQLSEIRYNKVNREIIGKQIIYDKIMSSDLDVQTSELFNSAHSAVSNSKKRMYVKKKMDINSQNITPNVERKMNTSPLRLLNQLVCGLDSKLMIACDNDKSGDTTYQEQNVCFYSDVLKVITSNTDGLRKSERKCFQKTSNLESFDYDIFDGIIDASEPRFCLCDQVAFGKMVACDNKACITEWYHYGCVGIMKPPRGKWYCPKCKNIVTKLKRQKKSM